MKILLKNSPHRTIGNPRADACLRAERRGDLNIEAFTATMFSRDLMGRGTPVLRLVTCSLSERSDPRNN